MWMNERLPLRFFVITFLWSWLIWSPLVLVGLGVLRLDEGTWSIIATPTAYLGAFGPAVGACCSVWTLKGRKALIDFLKSFLSVRLGWKVWVAIFAVLAAVNVVAWYVPELLGHDRLSMLLPSALVFPVWWLLMVLVGGGQEEIGWRGYILEPMEAKFGIWVGNIVLGLVWTAWHLPLFLVPGTSQTYMPLAAFAMGLIGQCFFFSWVMKACGGKPLSAVIAHGTANALVPLFPTIVMAPAVAQTRWWVHQTLLLIVGVLFMLHHVRSRAKRGRSQ
jgi:membrane protease YdiL (CAAX protease family)